MTKINLTDGSGKWFDRDCAIEFEESKRWNGQNHISNATGSQWDHEALYFTRRGMWVLHSWSQWQGSTPHYEEIGAEVAYRWLSAHADKNEIMRLPEAERERIGAVAASLES
jgi:hypothetical protein